MAAKTPFGLTLCLLFFSVLAWGQASTGTIVGAVHDPSGSAVPGATITVTDVATAVARTAATDQTGQYQVPALIPGTYTVKVSATGFTPQQANNVLINVQSRQLVNFSLKLGTANQQVEVVGTAPLLQTQSPDVASVISAHQIVNLPLNGRLPSSLALLSAGVTTFPPGEEGHPAPDRFNVSGNLDLENDFLLDGTDNNSGSENLQEGSVEVVQPPPDALEEFKVQSRTYSAAFGTSAGAVINASIKSGTNQFHGDLWDFLRNNALDSNTFFNNRNGVANGHFEQNQFGGTLGGPILHNNTFFFVDFQGLISATASTKTSSVPTPLMQKYNFSELPTSALPLTPVVPGQAGCVIANVVQSSCVGSVAAKLFSLYPAPNVPIQIAKEGTPNSYQGQNYQYVYSIPNHTYSTDARVDHTIGTKDQVFGRYSYNHSNFVSVTPWEPDIIFGNAASAQQINWTQSIALGWTHVLSPATVNQFHIGWNRLNANSDPVGLPVGQSDATQYGLIGYPVNPYSFGLPPISISGLTAFGGTGYRPQWQISQVWQYVDSLTTIRGNHSYEYGFEYHRQADTFLDLNHPDGDAAASGIYTKSTDGMADFLLGDMSTAANTTPYVAHNYYPGIAVYGQDTWRATSKLTLDYGLRYELFSPLLSRNNELSNFSPANGGELVPVAADASGMYARSTIKPDYKNFAPRIGFDYHALSDVVVRGGYGVFYQHRDRIGSESMLDLNPPNFYDATLSQQLGSTTPVYQLQNGWPSVLFPNVENLQTEQIRAQDPGQRTPYVEQASLGLEFQVMKSTVFDVTGVGNWARHMERLHNGNQGTVIGTDPGNNEPIVQFPYANLNSVLVSDQGTGQHNFLEMATYDGNTDYSGLEASLQRRSQSGLSYGVNYTWSHSMADFVDNLSGGPEPQNAYNYGAEMSNSNFNVAQRFVANMVWELPFGRNRRFLRSANGFVDTILGEWQTNGILTLQTGIPFSVSASKDVSYTGPDHTERPNCVGDMLAGATTDPSALVNGTGFYMNPAAFVNPSPGTFGNCAPRLLSGPGLEDIDFSLFKSIRVAESQSLQFRAEFFNAINHPNFGEPNGTVGSVNFGHITSTTNSPRQIQLALKYIF